MSGVIVRYLACVSAVLAMLVLVPSSSADVVTDLTAVLSVSSSAFTFPGPGCISIHLTRAGTGAPAQAGVLYNVTRMTEGGINGPGPPLADPHPTLNIHGTTDANGNGTACFTPTDLGRWEWWAVYATVGQDGGFIRGNSVDQTALAPPIPDAHIDTTISTGASTVVLGDTVPVTYTIVNSGQLAASGFSWLAQDMNGASDYLSATPSQGSCSGVLICDFGTLGSGARVTVMAELRARALGSIQLNAGDLLWAQGVTRTPPNLRSSTATATIIVVSRSANLAVSLTAAPLTVRKGGQVRALVTVSNAGPHTALDPLLTVDPRGFSVRAVVTPPGVRCAGSPLTCMLTPIANGAALQVQVVLRGLGAGRDRIVARVSSASAADPVTTNNTTVTAVIVKRRSRRS